MGCGGSKPANANGGAQKPAADKATEKKQAKDENKEYQAKMQFLDKVSLLKRLPKDQHPIVASMMIFVEFKAGASVIKQGDPGDEFFVIKSGDAKVLVKDDKGQPQKVAMLKAGDYFGENALLRDEPRTATICAESALSCYKIVRSKFQELGLNEKLQFANRKAVGVGGINTVEVHEPSPKTTNDRKLIETALKNNENLQTMVTLDEARVNALIDIAWVQEVESGETIISEGNLAADYFYIVASGSFEIMVTECADEEKDGPQSAERAITRGESKIVGAVGKGGSFGELALLYLTPRAATVKAKEKSQLWVLDRNNFKGILMKVSDQKVEEYMVYLEGCSLLAPLLKEEKLEVSKALVEMHFEKGEVVLQQGDAGNSFYILYDGSVSIIKDEAEVNELSASVARGTAQYFGEQALLDNEVRGATVKVTSGTAKALVLDRDSFNLLLGPLKDIIDRSKKDGQARKSSLTGINALKLQTKDEPMREKILRRDLKKIGLLGCGGFGLVELYEHKDKEETYAMKALSKGYIIKAGTQESVMNEKNILRMTNSVFIIKLFETYNGSQSLFFLLEPALGGELYATYNRKGLHGHELHAKYYLAGVIFAFEHCHERHIIYRDLKPENLLLTEKGHIKLTDMGLAKFVIGKTFTTCGTPDYFAPELIASTGHTKAVDWWTTGVLLFEFMSGNPPFESAYPMQIYSKVMKGIGKVPMPNKCQGACGDLIKSLLKQDPFDRLPMRPGGSQNIKDHKWFEGFDWDAAKELRLEPPYKPVVKSKKDLANFSARKEDTPRQIDYVDDGSGWDKDFATA